jgi:hypothetical protein
MLVGAESGSGAPTAEVDARDPGWNRRPGHTVESVGARITRWEAWRSRERFFS